VKRNKDTNKQERRERVKESRYNRKYERCMTEECGNQERENKYWREGEERRYRTCQLSTCGMDVAK
jgi:hypothetical protein